MGFWSDLLNGPAAGPGLADTGLTELAPVTAPARVPAATSTRRGYDSDVPIGGATPYNPGGDYDAGRAETMRQFYGAYTSCPWLSAPIDVIARTITAGGLTTTPDEDQDADAPPPAVVELQDLLDYVNPHEDVRQLLRGVITDLGIYGDSFTEIVPLLGKPVALYSLDAATMTVDADEHGTVTGYTQTLDGSRVAHFEPHEVVHVSMDAPRGSLYGIGTTEKAYLPVLIWLFTSGVLKETMRKGNPPNLWAEFGLEHNDASVRLWRQQYLARNLGPANIGMPITTIGDTKIHDLSIGKVAELLAILNQQRDVILSTAGVPPQKVGVIESGNLGGGTGTSQDRTFRINTCGPIGEIVLEKFNFVLLEAFGVDGWSMNFGDVDWRDDKVVEDIRDQRLRNGSWTLNRYRQEIGEPDLGDEGDKPVLVLSRSATLWADIEDLSQAEIDALANKGAAPGEKPPVLPKPDPTQPKPDEQPAESYSTTIAARIREHYRRERQEAP